MNRHRRSQTRTPALLMRGFSLLEMAVALLLLGIVVTAAIVTVGQVGRAADRDFSGGFDPGRVDDAIIGFVRANHRLPCPATDGEGVEDCSAGNFVGYLPHDTLQLSLPPAQAWRLPMAYSIYRGATTLTDLGVANGVRYQSIPSRQQMACGTAINGPVPLDCDVPEPLVLPAAGQPPLNFVVTQTAASLTPTVNVLDACTALAGARGETAAAPDFNRLHAGQRVDSADRANVAYAFAWSTSTASLGATDSLLESREWLEQDDDEAFFYRAGISPTGPDGERSDDLSLVRSFLEVAQALNCSERFGDIDLSLQSSSSLMANEYLNRVRLAHMKLFYEDAQSAVDGAARDIIFSTIDVAIATASLLLTVSEGVQGNPVAAVNIVLTTVELANSAAGLVLAIIGLAEAIEFLNYVEVNALNPARVRLYEAGDLTANARAIADLVQARGQL